MQGCKTQRSNLSALAALRLRLALGPPYRKRALSAPAALRLRLALPPPWWRVPLQQGVANARRKRKAASLQRTNLSAFAALRLRLALDPPYSEVAGSASAALRLRLALDPPYNKVIICSLAALRLRHALEPPCRRPPWWVYYSLVSNLGVNVAAIVFALHRTQVPSLLYSRRVSVTGVRCSREGCTVVEKGVVF